MVPALLKVAVPALFQNGSRPSFVLTMLTLPVTALLNTLALFRYTTASLRVTAPLLFQVLPSTVEKSPVRLDVPEVLKLPAPDSTAGLFQTNAPVT